MAVENDFLPFAVGGAANVLTQAQYAALTTLLADGFQTGTAQSQQLNKVWRQGSIMAAVIGQLIADATGQSVIDDGTVATIEANLARAIRGDAFRGVDNGAVDALAVLLNPAPLAVTPGMIVAIDAIVATNTGSATLNVNGLGALPIQGPGGAALQGGEFVAGGNAILRANAAATAWDLVWTTGALPVASGAYSKQAVNLGQLLQVLGRNNQSVYTTSTTLTAANAGQIVTYTGTASGTFTLPASNAAAAGLLPIIINNASSYALTVALPSGNTGGLVVNVLQPGQRAALWNDGASAWIELWNEAGNSSPTVTGNATASNQAVALGQFIESHGSSGYEKLPGGRIRQWAVGTAAAANTNQTVNLPIAFPTAIDSILASSSSVGTFATASPNGASLSSVLASASNTSGSFVVFVEGY